MPYITHGHSCQVTKSAARIVVRLMDQVMYHLGKGNIDILVYNYCEGKYVIIIIIIDVSVLKCQHNYTSVSTVQ